jgi:hypothetical protein
MSHPFPSTLQLNVLGQIAAILGDIKKIAGLKVSGVLQSERTVVGYLSE